MNDKTLGQQADERRDRLNDLYEEWLDILQAELTEGGGYPKHKRTAVHLTYGLDAIQRKIDELRAALADLDTAK